MNSENVIIKSSPINGRGIFALKNFKKGDLVLKWDTSHTIKKEEFDKLSEEEQDYVSVIGDKYIVMQEPEKYVNHSCNPNTEEQDFCDIALRDIQASEEITEDYAPGLEVGDEMKCHCGEPNCRKIIKKE